MAWIERNGKFPKELRELGEFPKQLIFIIALQIIWYNRNKLLFENGNSATVEQSAQRIRYKALKQWQRIL